MPESHSNPETKALTPLFSEFSEDKDMMELVDFFVTELHERVNKITDAWSGGETDSLRSLAHQLKGAGGGYGFPTITESAAILESAILSGDEEHTGLEEKVNGLLLLCKRAIAGSRGV